MDVGQILNLPCSEMWIDVWSATFAQLYAVQCALAFFYCKDGERFPGQAEVKRLCKDPINQQQVLQHFAPPPDYTLGCIAFETDISE